MKRSPIKRKKGMNRVSPRAVAYAQELQAIRPLIEARAGHRCEICRVGPVDHVHHRLRRSQGGKNTMENLLGLCGLCHSTVHDQPTLSYENGYLLRRG